MHPAGDPSARGWGHGWPSCQVNTWQKVTWLNGTSPAGGVRRELARLVELLGNATIRGGYALRAGQCWGAECRPITGTTNQPSLHSWGLAVDLNAPANPWQANDGSIVHDIPASVVALWATYGFRNGITYTGSRVDPMHMEFMGSPADAAAMLAQAAVHLAPLPPIWPPLNGYDRQYTGSTWIYRNHADPSHVITQPLPPARPGFSRVWTGRAWSFVGVRA